MLNPDDLEPALPARAVKDLQPLSVAELQEYIAGLEAEIARAHEMIGKKEAHKSGLAGLFKS